MTIRDVIEQIDELRPNTFSSAVKVRWLSDLDAQIKKNIIDTHELLDGETGKFTGYDGGTDISTVLLAQSPHDVIYTHWLRSQIDYAYEEYRKFNNSNDMFKAAYSDYERWYNRTHKPVSAKLTYF